ncbi:hypothetical protein J437_LFUL019186 [Ladona fulva]|uniref:Uncharacterized protein n=1 Tax=Ladona fulva TaxID=123851 RepID=A0A8K0KQA3_LADFU|nr:hypothetical protein J437_LFUL019186 [Ladona fulva]
MSRLILAHARSKKHGFLEHAFLLFQYKKTTDYHEEMNGGVLGVMMAGLEEGSVIVMDNASSHSILIEKIPTTKTREAVASVQWLINVLTTNRRTLYQNC